MTRFPFTLIDLSHPLDASSPLWDVGCGVCLSETCNYHDFPPGDTAFRVQHLAMPAGAGTHIDFPAHCFPDGAKAGAYTPASLLFPCRIIDARAFPDLDRHGVPTEALTQHEARHGPIPLGACALIFTGHGQYWNMPSRYRNDLRFPFVRPETAEALLQRNIAALGIDTLSPDLPDSGYPVHRLILGAGKLLIENVALNEACPAAGAFIFAAPVRLSDATEAPCRLTMFIPTPQGNKD